MSRPKDFVHPTYGPLVGIDPEAYGAEQTSRIQTLLNAGWTTRTPDHSSDLRIWTHRAWGPKTFRDAWAIYENDGIANSPK